MNRDNVIRMAYKADLLDPQHYGSILADKIEDKLLQCDEYQLRELVDAGAIGETMRLWIEQVREKRLH